MMAKGNALRATLRALPLGLAFAIAAWPFVLWLVHVGDPVAAVRLEQAVASGLLHAAWFGGGGLVACCLLFPLASAGLRLLWNRLWLGLTTDQAPLQRALSELRHFQSGARHFEVGRLARLRQRDELARKHLQQAVELDPGTASHWHGLGLVQFGRGAWAAAAASFRRAEELDPGHAFGEALLLQGRARHQLGEAEALALLVLHQQRHGGGPRSHVWLAEAHQRAGDQASALAALQFAAAPPRTKLSAEENWFRAVARMRTFGRGGAR